MELIAASKQDVIEAVLTQLGLGSDVKFMSEEFLASAIRYTASVVCPTSPRNLVSAVAGAMQSIVDIDGFREQCRSVLDELVAHGDLVESEDISSDTGNRLLYLAPPFFVRLNERQALVLGVAPDGVESIPEGVRVALRGVKRVVDGVDDPSVAQNLKLAGLEELPYSTWAKSPDAKSFKDVIRQFDRLIDGQPDCGDIEGLRVLRWDTPNRWYLKRWEASGQLAGRYVARRPRKYGADLWCYVELDKGVAKKLIDLPVGRTVDRGCDQAWRLQCAIDALQGAPQQYRATASGNSAVRVTIHIPPPAWLLRRWECVGTRPEGGVFVFEFEAQMAMNETELLERELWMEACED